MVKVDYSFQMCHLKRNLWWPSRISFCVPMTISSLVFSGTGCINQYCFKATQYLTSLGPQRSHYSQSHLVWNFWMLFQSSKLKARTSLLPHFSKKSLSSFELWTFKELSKMSPQMGLAVQRLYNSLFVCLLNLHRFFFWFFWNLHLFVCLFVWFSKTHPITGLTGLSGYFFRRPIQSNHWTKRIFFSKNHPITGLSG